MRAFTPDATGGFDRAQLWVPSENGIYTATSSSLQITVSDAPEGETDPAGLPVRRVVKLYRGLMCVAELRLSEAAAAHLAGLLHGQ